MNQPDSSAPATEPQPIIAEVYESRRMLVWSWRFRFIGANGEPLGHEYNDIDDARHAVNLIVKARTPVVLRIRRRDGSTEEIGRIR